MIELNKSLKAYNTFGFAQCAEFFSVARNEEQLEELIALAKSKQWPVLILGGGSNIVLTQDVSGLVIYMADTSIEVVSADDSGNQIIKAGAGVVWHDFVLKTLELGAQGLENLSLIPGSVGAAPVQNIGAYGVEVGDRIRTVRALHAPTGTWRTFTAAECDFAYRNSFFKAAPGDYVITSVEFNLGTQCEIAAGYDSLVKHLLSLGIENPTPIEISNAVIAIRESRLPNPKIIGNAGSFFHNPIIPTEQVQKLEQRFPEIVSFPAGDGFKKLSAAWMIDKAGFKGVSRGGVGVYEKQALVLVNRGNGSGSDILAIAAEIQGVVRDTYGVELSIEPTIL